jgi:hypothetical protein
MAVFVSGRLQKGAMKSSGWLIAEAFNTIAALDQDGLLQKPSTILALAQIC